MLDMSQLEDIVTALQKAYFSFAKWSNLGLKLGLYYTTISTIEKNHPRDAEVCLRECLSRWYVILYRKKFIYNVKRSVSVIVHIFYIEYLY